MPASEALDVAHLEALNVLQDKAEPERRGQIAWAITGLEALRSKHTVEPETLADYAGQYG